MSIKYVALIKKLINYISKETVSITQGDCTWPNAVEGTEVFAILELEMGLGK